ncbi:G-protein coupled receptor Mth2-like isoform X3 [Colias croceus]|uniref:G-protein coupled receptor Mth2-like isoform X3 n=1 Tax=Colias crocea TaxID=72248 RepID=UPI001E27F600|nr:G-protein coupled receptor Mth2-like isoform X3 [Colias croceus]
MYRLLIFFLFSFLNVNGQLQCDKNNIDLTEYEIFRDTNGAIEVNGTIFPPNFIFSRNVSGHKKTFGCPCDKRKCFRKCCPIGYVMYKRACTKMPDILQQEGLKLHFYETLRKTVNLESSDEFVLLTGIPCDWDIYTEFLPWFIQEDGKLLIETPNTIPPWTVFGPDKYCIDTFVYEDDKGAQTSKLDALVCFAEAAREEHQLLSVVCMLISCVFILVTVAVYCWLPELRNLHGRVLIAYLLSLFVGFVFLSTMKILLMIDNISHNCCVIFTFIIYFFLLAAFFWLNVMCFDIWWTFSGKRGMTMEKMSLRARFCAYSLYAFGGPTAFTILLASLEFSDLSPHPLLPLIRQQGCFLYGKSRLLYLYGPIVILCISNMVFFVLTALKITQIKQQTSVLKSKESATHDSHNHDKQRLLLYVKLFIVMGVNWFLEVISAIYPKADALWKFTDAYNVLIGLIIFIIFVCKRKIFRLIKKRYKQVRGQSMSRSQTTSSRTFSTKDEVALTSLKNN